MRAEEKELEGPELERDMRVEAGRQEEHEEEELPIQAGEEARDIAMDHRSRLFDALQLILARQEVNVSLLYLPQREALALETLQAAVTGKDTMGEFVFAEDRRVLLEQALAVLQQNLTYGEPAQLAELHAKFDALTNNVAELRAELTNLEDAQEELIEGRDRGMEIDGDRDDKPKPGKPEDASLTGPDRPEPAKPPSTLSGPERPAPAKAPSTLSGPERTEERKPPSVYDEASDAAARSDEAQAVAAAAAHARDKAEAGAADAKAAPAKKPWWKRPFG